MAFRIEYHQKVYKDLEKLRLNRSQLKNLKKKIEDISRNPFPKNQGGLGEPLSGNLKGLMKFRFDDVYRVVYRIVIDQETLKIIVIGLRADQKVYRQADERKK
jgi:mRNA interferase RelE/StbE